MLLLALPAAAPVVAAAVEGVPLAEPPPVARWLRGGHRLVASITTPPQGVTIEVAIRGDDPVEATLAALSRPLPPAAAPLLAARPPTAVPWRDGDAVIVTARVRL